MFHLRLVSFPSSQVFGNFNEYHPDSATGNTCESGNVFRRGICEHALFPSKDQIKKNNKGGDFGVVALLRLFPKNMLFRKCPKVDEVLMAADVRDKAHVRQPIPTKK